MFLAGEIYIAVYHKRVVDLTNFDQALNAYDRADLATRYGIHRITQDLAVHAHGFGDREFTPMFASALSSVVANYLFETGATNQASLTDHSRIMQSKWFLNMASQLALTRAGILQPFLRSNGNSISFLAGGFDVPKRDIFETLRDEDTGLISVRFSEKFGHAVRSKLMEPGVRSRSVGCPVARTAFGTTVEQANFLEEYGHLGKTSGFQVEHELTSGKVKISRGDSSTAIDDVIVSWADYIFRYANRTIFEKNAQAEGIIATDIDKLVSLD